MAKPQRHFIAIIDGTLWLRGSASKVFLSATRGGNGISWSTKPPAADARTAVPVDEALATTLRSFIKARLGAQMAAYVVSRDAATLARWGSWRPVVSASPSDAWVRLADLDNDTTNRVEEAIKAVSPLSRPF